jgi:two-component system nitrate/nitrite response regulator NarL
MIIDKAFGAPAVGDVIVRLRDRVRTAFVVWSASMTEPEALRFLKLGARAVVRKTADAATLLACLDSVVAGDTWMEHDLLRAAGRHTPMKSRTTLTPREHQVLELVEQGMRNKEIARELGIQPGTVKIHLKHIFEKTGVRGRYGLALSSLQRTVMPVVTV